MADGLHGVYLALLAVAALNVAQVLLFARGAVRPERLAPGTPPFQSVGSAATRTAG
jgi:hypothetical protein